MRMGKITQTAWQRTVRRQLQTRRDEVSAAPSPWTECSAIRTDQGVEFAWADACVNGRSPKTGFYAVLQAAGNLGAGGAEASGVSVRVTLPAGTDEEMLCAIAGEVERACSMLKLEVTAFQGEVSGRVLRPEVFACAAGLRKVSDRLKTGARELIFCGYAGLEGMLRILAEDRQSLNERFVDTFLDRAERLERVLVKPQQILQGCDRRTDSVRQVGSGGILAALWELSEQERIGFDIDMHQIALKQETVEICEHFRLNPYQMTSAGSFIIVTGRAEKVLAGLEKAGAPAVRLGTAGTQKARVIRNGGEIRYLDRPAEDEFMKWQEKREHV